MNIENFKLYRDGGTIELETDKGIFCFDNRIGTTTRNKLYDGYPKDNNSNLIENSDKLKTEIIESLKNYKNNFYQSTINNLINPI